MKLFGCFACLYVLLIFSNAFAVSFFKDASYIGCDYTFTSSNEPPVFSNKTDLNFQYYGVENYGEISYVYCLKSDEDFISKYFVDLHRSPTNQDLQNSFKDKNIIFFSYIFRQIEDTDAYLVFFSNGLEEYPELRYIAKAKNDEISFYTPRKTSFVEKDFYFSILKKWRVLLFSKYRYNNLNEIPLMGSDNYRLMPYKLMYEINQKISKADLNFISKNFLLQQSKEIDKIKKVCANIFSFSGNNFDEITNYINSLLGVWDQRSVHTNKASVLIVHKISYMSLSLQLPYKKIKGNEYEFPALYLSGSLKDNIITVVFLNCKANLSTKSCTNTIERKTISFSFADLNKKPLDLNLECGNYKFEIKASLKIFEIKEYRKEGENWVLQSTMKKVVESENKKTEK